MKIILDAMGGDNAPLETLKGAAAAVQAYGVEVLAVGQQAALEKCMQENGIPAQGITLVNASEVIEMCDDPARAIRRKKDSSIVVGLNLLAEGKGDAFVSAGSTGALHVGASLLVRTIPGVKRPALATVIPGGKKPYMLLDSGANVECRPQMLESFGVMGSVYMQKVQGVAVPDVALLNNGAEPSKGTPTYREAHALLAANPHIHFIGNIEPRDVPAGGADVVVADGFTGNVVLKLTEGLAKSLFGMVKQALYKNLLTKLCALGIKGSLSEMKKQLDSEEYGGAPFLGAAAPVIKAHGSSQARGIQNAIRQAKQCVDSDLVGTMEKALSAVSTQEEAE